MTEITVGYPEYWDVADWQRRFAAGEKPDAWPYGLNRLGAGRADVVLSTAAVGRKGVSAAARLLIGAGTSTPAGAASGPRIGVGWDETTVTRLAASGRFDAVFGGVIWSTDPGDGVVDRLKKRLVRRRLARADGLWCLSRPQLEAVERSVRRTACPVRFVRFGIDADFFRLRGYPERPLVLSIGGDRDRDPETLFGTLARVHAAMPEAELVVQSSAGAAPPEGVRVVPRVAHTELRELYARASVVVIATRPNLHVSGMTVSLEAMSTGRPVVITGTPGMDDYVDDAVGRVVRVGAADALAEAVVELLRAPDAAEALGRQGRAKVERQHTSAAMAEDLTAFLLDGR